MNDFSFFDLGILGFFIVDIMIIMLSLGVKKSYIELKKIRSEGRNFDP